jgi:DNA-directed RNA polymerase I, II, and III subunit RPABC3
MDIKPSIYLEDTFQVIDIDKDGKYFEKVSRINAKSDIYEFELQLDINSDIYYMEEK